MTTLHIQSGGAKPVAPDLYGLFFEDINRAGDGGLYPEMLRNRTFEDGLVPGGCTADPDGGSFTTLCGFREPFAHGEGTEEWAARVPYTPVPGWYAFDADMAVDTEDTLNPRREAALKVAFRPGGCIRNIGFHHIPATAGKGLLFYAFWKAEKPTSVTVRLMGKDGACLTSVRLEVPAGAYGRSDARLVPAADDFEACLEIACAEAGEITIGFTSLMPEETYHGHGLRKDLAELLESTHSKFMRWPGGCVVEGLNRQSAMRFTYTVGPVWERVSTWNLWHYRATNGFGFHEFLQLCEDMHMEALYVVNCGMSCQARQPEFFDEKETREMLEETMMAIEYATGDANTKWGALRAEMGHPEPFALKYIEIGNENDGPEYDKRYQLFYRELQKTHPEITLISNAHTETRDLPTQIVDEHYYFDWQFFAQSGHLYDHYPRDGVKVFLGEYAVTRGQDVGTLHSALSEARFLLGLESNPEVVKLASFAPLFENVLYKQWNPNLISFDNHRSCGLPVLHVLGLLGSSRGTELLRMENDTELLRPEKYGFCGVIAYQPGLRMLMPEYNGAPAALRKEVIGHWLAEGEELVSDCTGNDKLDSITRFPIQLTIANGLFTDRKANRTEFSAKVYMDEHTPKFALTFWAHNSSEPGVMTLEPEPGKPESKKVFGLGDTEYYTWTIENGKGRNLYLYRYQEHPLSDPVDLPIRYGEYNKFTVRTSGSGYDCYLNDVFICHGEDRAFGRVDALATMDEDTLYLKLLNNTDQDETVRFSSDIPLADGYAWSVVRGAPEAMNTLDAPETIHAEHGTASDGSMTYTAPRWSFSVLAFKRI